MCLDKTNVNIPQFGEAKTMKCGVLAFLCVSSNIFVMSNDTDLRKFGKLYSLYAQDESIEFSEKDLRTVKYCAERIISQHNGNEINTDVSVDLSCEELVCGLNFLGIPYPYKVSTEMFLNATNKVIKTISEMKERGYVLY